MGVIVLCLEYKGKTESVFVQASLAHACTFRHTSH